MIREIETYNIGNWIKEKRKELGYKQYQFAPMIPVNVNTLSRYESGDRVPTWDVIEKIAELVGAQILIREKADYEREEERGKG